MTGWLEIFVSVWVTVEVKVEVYWLVVFIGRWVTVEVICHSLLEVRSTCVIAHVGVIVIGVWVTLDLVVWIVVIGLGCGDCLIILFVVRSA